MLYFFYGTDRVKLRAQFQKMREKFSAQGVAIEVIPEGGVTRAVLDGAITTRGLFGETTLFVLDGVLEKKDEQEIISSRAAELASSSNIFLVIEPSPLKECVTALCEHAVESFEFALTKQKSWPAFNIFSLGDALGKRNKKDLWVLYQQALGNNMSPEEISGTLFWSIKNMTLMKTMTGGGDAGLSPTVAPKARSAAKNYSLEELHAMSRSLVHAYHEGHRGGDMAVELEEFILKL